MPKGSRSWRASDVQVYGPNDESVSLWNDALKAKVTLYTYPASKPLQQEFDGAMEAMSSKSCTEGPVMSTKVGDRHIGGCVRRLEHVLVLEQVLVFQRNEWSHKARITLPAPPVAHGAAMQLVGQAFGACPADST